MIQAKAKSDTDIWGDGRKRPENCADCGHEFGKEERGHWVGFDTKRCICGSCWVAPRSGLQWMAKQTALRRYAQHLARLSVSKQRTQVSVEEYRQMLGDCTVGSE